MKKSKYHRTCFYGLILVILLLSHGTIQAVTVDYTEQDSLIFERYKAKMRLVLSDDLEHVLIETAMFFIGTPYAAATLERQPERTVINLRELDCTTFVENVLALVRTLRTDDPSFANFCNQIAFIRYRAGVPDGYTSRLHYATDWLQENERKRILQNITPSLKGAEALNLSLSFMSTHPESYPALKDSLQLVGEISKQEQKINQSDLKYIPKKLIIADSLKVRNGDVVFFTTSIKGLDVTHMGLVYKDKSELKFIHASQTLGKVVVHTASLRSYTEENRRQTGVIFARPL